NVEDEGNLRLESRDVREILLRSHTQVHAAWLVNSFQFGNDVLKSQFIREEIFEPKVAVLFRKSGNRFPERFVAEAGGKSFRSVEGGKDDSQSDEQKRGCQKAATIYYRHQESSTI